MNERRQGQGPPAGRAPGQRGQERRGSGDAYAVPLPRAACAAWQRYGTSRCQNAGLVFDRFAPRWDHAPSRQVGAIKQQGLNAVRQAADRDRVDRPLVRAWNQRWQAAASFIGAVPFTATTDWRLVTGLGRKGPLEVGFTLHRYGLPYLPGSGVKGLARTTGLLAVAGALGDDGLAALRAECIRRTQPRGQEPSELAALAWALELDTDKAFCAAWEAVIGETRPDARALAEDFRAIFGTTGKAGGAVFLDAIPEGVPKLDLDIMNPHFPEYYRDGTGKTPPTDWQNPVPVFFLTVAAGTPFRFAVGWRGPREGEWRRQRDQAVAWLRQGLEELGAGGKTGAGYGYFVPAPAAMDADQPATATTDEEGMVPETIAPPAVIEEREGTIAEYNVAAGRGRIRDDRTGDQVPFTRNALVDKSWTPGRGRPVRYAIQVQDGESTVVRVERRVEG